MGFKSQLIQSIIFMPRLKRGALHVLGYNYAVFRQNLLMNFFWIGFEPLVYLYAIGFGVGRLIPEIQGGSYFRFFFPGLMAITAMIVPSYETTHGTYRRAHMEKTFTSLYLTPITAVDLFIGEILWATLKGVLSLCILLVVLLMLGQVAMEKAVLLLFAGSLISWFFAVLGLLVNSLVENSESFIFYQAGFLIPMAMLSGAYFPLEYLPEILQYLMKLLPLTYGVILLREINLGFFGQSSVLGLFYFITLGFLLTNLSLFRQTKKFAQLLD